MVIVMLALFVIALSLALSFVSYLVLYVTGQHDREAVLNKAAMEASDRLAQKAWEARAALWESARSARDSGA